MVLGNSKCGAVKGACSHVEMGHLTGLLEKIQPAVEKVESNNQALSFDEKVEEVAVENVKLQMEDILRRSSILRNLYKEDKIGLAGGMYSVETGVVEFFDVKFHENELNEMQLQEEMLVG